MIEVLFGLLAVALILVALHGLIFVRAVDGDLRLLSVLGLLFAAVSWLTLIPLATFASMETGFEKDAFHIRALSGPYILAYWFSLFLPVVIAQSFWLRRVRVSPRLSLIFTLSSLLVWLAF